MTLFPGPPARRRGRLAALLAIGAAAAAAAPATAQQTTVPAACPATFSVLHDDRIGALAVPAGAYALSVTDPARLSCAQAADRFRQFLEDWDGRLPVPWRLDGASATFSAGAGVGFRVAAVATPSGGGGGGGGGGGQYPATGARCPGTFSVLHDDRIGPLAVPAGSYTITLTAVGRLSCARATNRFAAFLRDFDGRLPSPWVLEPQTATFLKAGSAAGFRVEPSVGPAPTPTPGGRSTHPAGRQCAGTFQVLHDDRIGRLRLPAGRYRITLAASGRPSCALSARYLARFLRRPDGRLPQPWRVDPASGTFTGRSGRAFRVKPAGATG